MSKVPQNSKIQDMEASDDISKSYGMISHGNRTFLSIEPNRSVRPSFTKRDYTNFRRSESVPSRQKEVIGMCMDAYENVGLIRNIIDLMGDFACQGMTIVHPNKSEEKFYRKWFAEINGVERTERFLNYFYRTGNVVVRRSTAKITPKTAKRLKSTASEGRPFEEPKVKEREIPWVYEFLNPLVVEYKQEGANKPKLYMNLTESNYNKLIGNSSLPQDIRKILSKHKKQIPLDESKVRVFHYKKDDWLLWANPMIRPILDDIVMLEKMKLADLAALDGAISNVRLWTLGNLEYKIPPTKAGVDKLRDILASNVGGGTMDLIWGPDLAFQESASQVYKFLGGTKYEPVLASIYAGLGIPASLTGTSSASGFTNNYVSLKTLIERLEYGRQAVLSFWLYEFKLVQLAMGFKNPPSIHFDNIVLSDEAAVNTLLVSLADRDIISNETLLERLGELPEIEEIRIKRENMYRKEIDSPKKASPFHNPMHTEDVAKLAISEGMMPKEYFDRLGLPWQKPPVKPVAGVGGNKTQKAKPKQPSGGRPKNTKDTQKRKTKRVLPRTGAEINTLSAWAMHAQKEITEMLNPIALQFWNKKNIRSLTKDAFEELEFMKLCALSYAEPFSTITNDFLEEAIAIKPDEDFIDSINFYKSAFISKLQREPSLDDLRMIYAMAYAENN